jgi:hypothetical protein
VPPLMIALASSPAAPALPEKLGLLSRVVVVPLRVRVMVESQSVLSSVSCRTSPEG